MGPAGPCALFLLSRNHRLCRWYEKSFSEEEEIKTPFGVKWACGLATARNTKRRTFEMNDSKSLAHTRWNCKYHIVFAPKYRRKEFYGEKRAEIGKILRELCEWKGVNIVEAEVCEDHIHMLVEIPPKMSVSSFMGFLKGKSSLIIHERHANLKYKHGNRSFWCRGYYVDTAGKNAKKIAEYIKNQLEEDKLQDQLTFREYEDPFKGNK